MKKRLLGSAALCIAAAGVGAWAVGIGAWAADAPSVGWDTPHTAYYITKEDLAQDIAEDPQDENHVLASIDSGFGTHVNIDVQYREGTLPGAHVVKKPPQTPEEIAAHIAELKRRPPCGAPMPTGSDVRFGPLGKSGGMMINHHDVTEIYVILKGGGTMITGGTLFRDPKFFAAGEQPGIEDDTGASCTGRVFGDWKAKLMKVGDILVLPPDTPHGFSEIDPEVQYLDIRIDPKNKLAKRPTVMPDLGRTVKMGDQEMLKD